MSKSDQEIAMAALREEVKSLMRSTGGIMSKGLLIPCQRRCLSFDAPTVSDTEQQCLQ